MKISISREMSTPAKSEDASLSKHTLQLRLTIQLLSIFVSFAYLLCQYNERLCINHKTMAIIYSFWRRNLFYYIQQVLHTKFMFKRLIQSPRLAGWLTELTATLKVTVVNTPEEFNVLWNLLCHGCVHTTCITLQVFVRCVTAQLMQ